MPHPNHVVLILHGIRTQAEWAQRTANALEATGSLRARPLRYGFFDLIKFLLPGFTRRRPIERFTRLVRDEMAREPERLSVIAHSFGTYIVAKILENEADVCFHRLILCGSIIDDEFAWERYSHRLDPDKTGDWHAVNDCGLRDRWPVFAKSVTWGYGSSGSFGFGHTRVKDRYFDVGHSGFFSDEHVSRYWVPYLCEGNIVVGQVDRPHTAWWVSLLTVAKLRYAVLAVLAAAVWLSANVTLTPDIPPLGTTQTGAVSTSSSNSPEKIRALPDPVPDVLNTGSIVSSDRGVELAASFIERYADRATLVSRLSVERVGRVHAPQHDGDLHVVGQAPEVRLPIVVEVMNAASQPDVVNLLTQAVGALEPTTVSGAWRIWFEGMGSAEVQRQGQDIPESETSGPAHYFELHPVFQVGNLTLANTFSPIKGFTPHSAERALAVFEKATISVQTDPNTKRRVVAVARPLGYNYVEFDFVPRASSRSLKDGQIVIGSIRSPGDRTLVESVRVVTVSGTQPDAEISNAVVGRPIRLIGIPRLSLKLLQGLGDGDHKLPYELIAAAVLRR